MGPSRWLLKVFTLITDLQSDKFSPIRKGGEIVDESLPYSSITPHMQVTCLTVIGELYANLHVEICPGRYAGERINCSREIRAC